MITTDPKCGKSWGGLKAEHCTACHETFSGTAAGDRHRVGPGNARRCIPPAEASLVFDPKRQVWRFPGIDPTSRNADWWTGTRT